MPRANNVTILSNEYVDKTRAMLAEYGEISLSNFSSMWLVKYNEIIDFVSLKYNGGLLQFICDNNHLFEVRKNEDNFNMVSLISRPNSRDSRHHEIKEYKDDVHSPMSPKQRNSCKTSVKLLNSSSFLWVKRPWKLCLKNLDFKIAQSAFESAMKCKTRQAVWATEQCRAALAKFPEGLHVLDLYRHVPAAEIMKIFSVTNSITCLIDELPEIFYRKRVDDSTVLFYDGHLYSISDLSGNDDQYFEGYKPEDIATRAINEGLYQKTLMLLHHRGPIKGLKINVWKKSMWMTFYDQDEDAFEADFNKINSLTFFLALARFNLVELRSDGRVKNDIRAFMPRTPIEFMDLKWKLVDLANVDSASDRGTDED